MFGNCTKESWQLLLLIVGLLRSMMTMHGYMVVSSTGIESLDELYSHRLTPVGSLTYYL